MMTYQQRLYASAVFLLFGTLFFNGCRDKTIEERTYMANVPIYMNMNAFRASVSSVPSKALSDPGKIHFKGNYLFVVDKFKGIHIIDNSNPSSPQNIGYISVPGNVDIASKGGILYADSYCDLLAIDITDPLNVKVSSRTEDVLPQILPPTGNNFPIAEIDESEGVVIGWKVEEITERIEVESGVNSRGWKGGEAFAFSDNSSNAQSSGSGNNSPLFYSNGKSGSMARFTVFDNYLYMVNENSLQVFNISDNANPVSGTTIDVGRVVETIFPMAGKLFIGTTSGMAIYDLSVPSSPQFLSDFNHATSCDPVVVEGDYAYITLRTGNLCGGWSNQLDVVDISDITNPSLVQSYAMTNPYGLGIDNGTLFICDGTDGLKVYDASDPNAISQNMLDHFQNINTYDVIPYYGLLMMIGDDGLYQYDYSDTGSINLLSVISVN